MAIDGVHGNTRYGLNKFPSQKPRFLVTSLGAMLFEVMMASGAARDDRIAG